MPARALSKQPSAAAQLRSFLSRFDPGTQRLFRSVRTAVRTRFPNVNELVYEYRDSVVIGYSPTTRGIEAIVAIAARADGVLLYLSHGPQLPDPKGLLQGSGKQTRFIRVDRAAQLRHPDVKALITAAVAHATVPLSATGKGRLIIQSAASTRRPATRG